MSSTKIPRNIMEDIVEEKLDALIRATNLCRCEQCRADVKAIVLNSLPSRYVSSTSGAVLAHYQLMDVQSQASITKEILMAIAIVHKSPRHHEDIDDVYADEPLVETQRH